MKVIRPVEMTPAKIKSSTLTEANASWSSVTTYSIGNKVTYDYKTWESLTNSNTNNQPNTSPTHWVLLGASNSFALFDGEVNTQSTATNSITVTCEFGASDTIAFLNVIGNMIDVTVRDNLGGNIIYQSSQSLQGDVVIDWYQYFFFDYLSQRTQAVFQDIPKEFLTAHVTFTLTGTGTVAIGAVVFGASVTLGGTQYGVNTGIIDYSRKETDEFGVTTFVKRNFSKRLSASVFIGNNNLNRVQRFLYDIRATPTLWIASPDVYHEEATVVFGFYKEFSNTINYPTSSLCNIEVEGLI